MEISDEHYHTMHNMINKQEEIIAIQNSLINALTGKAEKLEKLLDAHKIQYK